MSRPESPGSQREERRRRLCRAPRGGITWVGAVLLAGVVGGGYLAWVWVPLYVEHYLVKQVVRDYINQAIKNPSDALLRAGMVQKIHAITTLDTVDDRGKRIKVPAVEVDERAVTWERTKDTTPPTLRVAFDYERAVVYPLIDRVETKVFEVDITGDLTLPDWGPAR